ncbi:MAG: helix-turn-helix domain-containing protein [Chloroflexota bacterium]
MPEEKLVYSPAEAQRLLGLGRTTVYERIRDGSLPAVRIGRRLMIPREALLRMLSPEQGAGSRD